MRCGRGRCDAARAAVAASAVWVAGAALSGCEQAPWPPPGEAGETAAPRKGGDSGTTLSASRPAPITRAEAQAFLAQHDRLVERRSFFQGWRDDNRRASAAVALEIARRFRGEPLAARALLLAAEAHAGACEGTKPLGPDGWDRAIALYRRMAVEHPGTRHERAARWRLAGCHGCWARWDCCRFNQGKGDWAKAIRLYEELYDDSDDAGSRCDALRRIAEIQCNCAGDWRDGLKTYRRIYKEFGASPPPSPWPTNRTCGPLNGTHLLDFDIVEFTHARLMREAKTPEEAQAVHDEFVRLAPRRDTIRFHAMYQLAAALRRLGAAARADRIRAVLGLCRSWVVVGPFRGPADGGDGPIPRDLSGLPRLRRIWRRHLNEAMRTRIRTLYAPERDCRRGRVDLAAAYRVVALDGPEGTAMWVRPTDSRMLHKTYTEFGALYALTYVRSPKAQDARLRVALSGFARVYLNGKSVLATDVMDYPVMDQHVGPIRLKAGRNALFVKIVPWDKGFGSYVRITDKLGRALDGLRYERPTVPKTNRARSSFLRKPADSHKG